VNGLVMSARLPSDAGAALNGQKLPSGLRKIPDSILKFNRLGGGIRVYLALFSR